MKDGDVGTFYVWDYYKWTMSKLSLHLRVATHESWYETANGTIVDPLYVGNSEREVYDRMLRIFQSKLEETEQSFKDAQKNLRRFKKYNPNR